MSQQVGCALCGATWGDWWEETEGKKRFFCCEICAKQYKNIIGEAKKKTGWATVDKLKMEGDYRGRICRASHGLESTRFLINFLENGDVRTLIDLD